MKISFANPHIEEVCRTISGMEQGRSYGFGEIHTKRSHCLHHLVRNGFLTRKRGSSPRYFLYSVTDRGQALGNLMRSMGIKRFIEHT